MATAESTPQSSPEGKLKERKIYPLTDEIYEEGERVFWETVREHDRKKAAQQAAQQQG